MADKKSVLRTSLDEPNAESIARLAVTPQITPQAQYALTDAASDSQFVRGLRTGAAGLSAGNYANTALSQEFARDPNWKVARDAALKAQAEAQGYAPRVQSLRDIGGLNDVYDYATGALGQGIVSMAPTIGGSIVGSVGGPVGRYLGGAYAGYGVERGEAALNQYADPVLAATDVAERNRAASGKAFINTAFEALVPAGVAKTLTRGPVKGTIRKIESDLITEGLTETTQGIVDYGAKKYLDPNRQLDPMDLADAFAGGAITGAGVSAGAQGIGHTMKAAADKLIAEAPPIAATDKPVAKTSVKKQDFVADTFSKMSEVAKSAVTPEEYLDRSFGNGNEDNAVRDLRPDIEDPGILNAGDPEAALLDRDAQRKERSAVYAAELLEDPSTPQLIKERIAAIGDDLSDPSAQNFVAQSLVELRKNQRITDTVNNLVDTPDIEAPAESGVKKNLQDTSPTEQAAFNKLIFDSLTDEAKANETVRQRLPDLANKLLAYAARTGELTPQDMKTLSRVRDGFDLFADPDATAAKLLEYTGVPRDSNSFLERIKQVTNAQTDIKKPNSFLYTSLSGAAKDTLTPRQMQQVARLVDEVTLSDKKRGDDIAASLTPVFGSKENVNAVLDYYWQQNQSNTKYDPNETIVDGTSNEETKYESGMQERESAPEAGYHFADAKARRPFRAFVGERINEGGMRRRVRESTKAALALRASSPSNSRVRPIKMSEYVQETGRNPLDEMKRVRADIEERIKEHKSHKREDRSKQIAEHEGTLSLMKDVYQKNGGGEKGASAALDLFEVLKTEGQEKNDLVTTDEELSKMATSAKAADAKETHIVFKQKDGKKLLLSAESMWKTQGDKEGSGRGEVVPSRAKRLFSEALASVLARPDIAGLETPLEDIKIDRAMNLWAQPKVDPLKTAVRRDTLKNIKEDIKLVKSGLDSLVNAYEAGVDREEIRQGIEENIEYIRSELKRVSETPMSVVAKTKARTHLKKRLELYSEAKSALDAIDYEEEFDARDADRKGMVSGQVEPGEKLGKNALPHTPMNLQLGSADPRYAEEDTGLAVGREPRRSSQQGRSDNKAVEKLNVWAGTGENRVLSNLAPRPFEFNGRKYFSVEHAYQTLKSGEFDADTYSKYTSSGYRKIPGRQAKTEGGYNVRLMERLMRASFEQNPEALKALKATGDAIITHTQDRGVWRDEFPRILMEIRGKLASEAKAVEVSKPRAEPTIGNALDKTKAVKDSFDAMVKAGQAVLRDGVYYLNDTSVTKYITGTRAGVIYVNMGKLREQGLGNYVGSSPQKRKVFEQLGITPEALDTVLGNTKRKAAFLRDHERSHLTNRDADKYPRTADGTLDLMHKDAIAMELRATKDALSNEELSKMQELSQTEPVSEAPAVKPARVVLTGNSPYLAKDQRKSDKATKFIGRGSTGSSTAAYAKAWGDRANSGKYEATDRVFVSVNGNRPGALSLDTVELDKALQARARIITDGLSDRMRAFNSGERQLAQYLRDNGYREIAPGEWAPVASKQSAMDVEGQQDNETDKAAILAEIERIRGKDIKVAFSRFAANSGSGSYANYYNSVGKRQRIIRIAVNAVNPMGVAWHESLHDFFAMLDSEEVGRSIKKDLADAANVPHVKNKLRELLKDHPAAREQIEKDSEERAAYMYQFWNEGLLSLGNTGTDIFSRIKQLFVDLLGVVTSTQRAEDLLTALHEGRFADLSTAGEVINSLKGDRLSNKFNKAFPKLSDSMHRLYKTAPDRLRAFQNSYLNELADMFDSDWGSLGFIQRRFQQQGVWENKMLGTLEGTTSAERRVALENLQAMKAPVSELEKRIAKFMDDIHQYQVSAGVETREVVKDSKTGKNTTKWTSLRKVKNYFPRNWDRSTVERDRANFVALLQREGNLDSKAANAVADEIISGIGKKDLEESELALGFTPFAPSSQARVLTFITPANAEMFAAYQTKDLALVLNDYVRQTAHRAEYARMFGNQGEVIVKKVLASGITKASDLKEIGTIIQALEGTIENNLSPKMKEFMFGVMSLQNLVVLPLAVVSQMVDPIVLAARTGDLRDAGRAYVTAIKRLVGKEVDGEELSLMLGTISQDSVLDAMGVAYGATYGNKHIRKLNHWFFKLNGMQTFNTSMRIAATVAGERYLIANKDNLLVLSEVGLKPSDIKVNADGRLNVDSTKMQLAMFKFVDQAVLRPSAGNRPVWMSDPRFMLVAHLKQFTFALHNVILKRATRELVAGNHRPWGILMLAMPVMLAADIAKFSFMGTLPPGWGYTDYMVHAIERSGLLGVSDFGIQALQDIERGRIVGESLLGPSFEHLMMILRALSGEVGVQEVVERTVPGARFVI